MLPNDQTKQAWIRKYAGMKWKNREEDNGGVPLFELFGFLVADMYLSMMKRSRERFSSNRSKQLQNVSLTM